MSRPVGDVPRRTNRPLRVTTEADRSALTRMRNCEYDSSPSSTVPFRITPSFTALDSDSVYAHATYDVNAPSDAGDGSPETVATRR